MNANEPREELPDFDQLWNYSDPAGTEITFLDIYEKYQASASPSYLAQLLSQIARTQGLQGYFEESFETIKEAEKICPEEDPLARVRILLETGRLHNSSGQKETARQKFLEAKDLAVKEALDPHFDFHVIMMIGKFQELTDPISIVGDMLIRDQIGLV